MHHQAELLSHQQSDCSCFWHCTHGARASSCYMRCGHGLALNICFGFSCFASLLQGKKKKKKKKKRKNRKKNPNPSNSLKASKLSSCKCPKKLMSGLCLPKTWHPAPSPAMPSAAPLPAPWGGAGSGIRRVLSALFWKKRNYKPCTHKCFEETKVLAGRIASLTKALR